MSGVNVTLIAGSGLVACPPDAADAAPIDESLAQGGIGTPENFLEINVDLNDAATPGVLRLDTTAVSTLGVFLTDTAGSLAVHTVDTDADASLVTLAGSIL